jgi:hypothetical protein
MLTAIIVEPRKHKALEFVLNNVCSCLEDVRIVLFHGTQNKEYSEAIVERLNPLHSNCITLVQLDVEDLNQVEYSRLFATKSVLYDWIHTEHFLVFQTDSMLFKIEIPILFESFLAYDYVGAPWLQTMYVPTKECGYIGNGGFSLRRTSKMLELIEAKEWTSKTDLIDQLEDLFFCRPVPGIQVNKPSYEIAKLFCVDEVFSPIAMSCHKPWFHAHYEQFKVLYPEVELLRALQGVEV